MHLIERSLVAATFLMTGVLLFVSESRTWEKARTVVCNGSDSPSAAAAQAIGDGNQEPAASFVANSFCMACHADFDEEELALSHEIWGIGCERCHGESFRHRSDEANITPPEIMYPKERVNPSCMSCHPRHDIQDTKDHESILEVNLNTSEEAPSAREKAKKYCTDCHGSKHHMNLRTIRWDKATGTLLKISN